MSKQSAFMAQLNAQVKRMCDLQRRFTIQQMEDMALIALGELYEERHEGERPAPELVKAFRDVLRVTLAEYAETAIQDDAKTGNNDPRLNYTKGKIDAALEPLLGDAFEPWESRYTM